MTFSQPFLNVYISTEVVEGGVNFDYLILKAFDRQQNKNMLLYGVYYSFQSVQKTTYY